ncbi:COPII coat assembly protein SEC16 [Purpureocillium lavendulum]|uniref:Protein transport protein sec16 n=1 Tax=Purpureocillium lavendulum TaxID=1247861 RepID=A0AB34FGY6_9HYPO|nr:COPII coat assembly protein SEC16 [Purpureocillium lavendulum]
MASELPSSAWHPALMPNSIHAAATPSHDPDTAAPVAPEPATASAPESKEEPSVSPVEPNPENGQDSADAWFGNDGDGEDGDAWLVSDHAEPTSEATPQAADTALEQATEQHDDGDAWLTNDGNDHGDAWLVSDDAKPDDVADQAADVPPPAEPAWPQATKHSSSMSFARTVSHDINFNDDDGTEFSLTRSDTDTFSFMPPSDRTNSFPVVPPMTAGSDEHDDQPLPATQALDLLEETEREAEFDEQQYLAGNSAVASEDSLVEPKSMRPKHGASRSIGGEGQEPDPAEARYEEGIPLIPQAEAGVEPADVSKEPSFTDPFAEDEGNDDGFFSQAQTTDVKTDDHADNIHPIERKSTMQVMGSLDHEPLARQGTLVETVEEHDEDAVEQAVNEAQPPAEDLASKWQEAFASDDDEGDFLLEDSAAENKDIDAAAFLGSDDEGFLDDDDEAAQAPKPAPAVSSVASNPYAPAAAVAPQSTPAAYTPATTVPTQGFAYQEPAPTPFGQPPPPRPELTKAQSFADKSKGGYASPYDLPTDLVNTTIKPRKRASMQQLPKELPQAPPRSASMTSPNRPPSAGPPPAAVATPGPPLNQKASAPALRSQGGFFEDLPVTAKPRPGSRQSNRAPSPSQYTPHTQQPASFPPTPSALPPASTSAMPQQSPHTPGIANLVAPERVSPYATLQSAPSMPPPSTGSTRYSPAPAHQPVSQSAPPPAGASRYSPAPAASRSGGSYSPSGPATPSQPAHPHLPRTSSPLAHFDSSIDKMHSAAHGPNGDMHHADRRSSSSFEPRLSRVSSLPPTREVDEEDEEDAAPANRSFSASHPAPPVAHAESKYGAAAPPTARYTPPLPSANHAAATLSPPKRTVSNYMPHSASAPQPGMAPPARASTQSPTATHRQYKPADAGQRPSSSHSSGVPPLPKTMPAAHAPTRTRGQSLSMNMVAPTDGREQDPLGRWKGVPLVAWGVGGTVVTSFPQSVPRYSMNQTAPTIVRTAGEVKVRHIKDIEPLQDQLAKFPGPLRGKSRKKEALAWLAAGIDAQEKELPEISFHSHLSLEAKRGVERLLLWKLLRVFVEHDGTLEGTPAVDKAVRDILSPGTVTPTADNDALFPTAAGVGAQGGPLSGMQADGADPAAMENIRLNLLKGDRETAVWSAVDKRLWGHAMLISQTVSPDLYRQVAQEFVRKEVNYPGHSNESLGALYKVLSGNYDDCVDELVPSHARAGLQLMTTESSGGPARDAVDGLDKWRETVTLILSNRSSDDVRGLNALGKLLSSYGRAEAAHICFMFSRSLSVFGGLDDPNVDFVLLGSDHQRQSDQFAKETEALQLSEVYEYGLSLGNTVAASAGAPHLAAYKLQHAITLAEYGFRDKALQYCDAIAAAMVSQTKRSPHYHVVLEAAVEDFMTRLKQAPKEMSTSWMSKPSMNKVSDSMWNRFNKFVAGDDADGSGNGTGEHENGPFARITSSPNMSRSPSVSNFEVYGVASPGYTPNTAPQVPAPAASATASKYAPAPVQPAGLANPYAPSHYPAAPTSSGRSSHEYSRNPYEPARPGTSSSAAAPGNGYAPTGYTPAAAGYQPVPAEPAAPVASHEPAAPQQLAPSGFQPYGLQESPSIYPSAGTNGEMDAQNQGYQPPTYGYEPPSTAPVVDTEEHGAAADRVDGGYEPPSFQPYGYEPPSYQPELEAEDDDEASKPKKKGIMYDDDDDIAAGKPQEKSKADKDRENAEMFRKAAEEDGKNPRVSQTSRKQLANMETAKRAASQQAAKKGWGFSNWFGGSKKEEGNIGEASPGKPIRAKLGEASSFVYDPELKRWVNKKSGAENTEAKKATPPPPRAMARSASGTPQPADLTPPPPAGRSSVPPPAGPPRPMPGLAPQASTESLSSTPPTLSHSASNPNLAAGPPSGPPSRPTTSMSNASSIDDLLGAAGPRKAGQKKPRKGGRYVDVMAK